MSSDPKPLEFSTKSCSWPSGRATLMLMSVSRFFFCIRIRHPLALDNYLSTWLYYGVAGQRSARQLLTPFQCTHVHTDCSGVSDLGSGDGYMSMLIPICLMQDNVHVCLCLVFQCLSQSYQRSWVSCTKVVWLRHGPRDIFLLVTGLRYSRAPDRHCRGHLQHVQQTSCRPSTGNSLRGCRANEVNCKYTSMFTPRPSQLVFLLQSSFASYSPTPANAAKRGDRS